MRPHPDRRFFFPWSSIHPTRCTTQQSPSDCAAHKFIPEREFARRRPLAREHFLRWDKSSICSVPIPCE